MLNVTWILELLYLNWRAGHSAHLDKIFGLESPIMDTRYLERATKALREAGKRKRPVHPPMNR